MNTDFHLVQACRSGSLEAFEAIVSRYQNAICAITYSAVANHALSEDLAQDTFVLAWKKLDQLRDPAKLRPWLYSIARSTIRNHFRQQKRTPEIPCDVADMEAHASLRTRPSPWFAGKKRR